MYHYIYLVQEIQFSNTNIYKIGKTTRKPYQRFNQYSKGVVIWYARKCKNCHIVESRVITRFKRKFKQRRDISGAESFEGNPEEMIDEINLIVKTHNEVIIYEEMAENHISNLKHVHTELKSMFVTSGYRIHRFEQYRFNI
jgi:hypothetical protein